MRRTPSRWLILILLISAAGIALTEAPRVGDTRPAGLPGAGQGPAGGHRPVDAEREPDAVLTELDRVSSELDSRLAALQTAIAREVGEANPAAGGERTHSHNR